MKFTCKWMDLEIIILNKQVSKERPMPNALFHTWILTLYL